MIINFSSISLCQLSIGVRSVPRQVECQPLSHGGRAARFQADSPPRLSRNQARAPVEIPRGSERQRLVPRSGKGDYGTGCSLVVGLAFVYSRLDEMRLRGKPGLPVKRAAPCEVAN